MKMTEITLQAGDYVARVEEKAIQRVMIKERIGRQVDLIKLSPEAFNNVEDEHQRGMRPQGTPWYFSFSGDLLRVFPTPTTTTHLVVLSTNGDDDGAR